MVYSAKPKGSFCSLVRGADIAFWLHMVYTVKSKCRICLLVREADNAFWCCIRWFCSYSADVRVTLTPRLQYPGLIAASVVRITMDQWVWRHNSSSVLFPALLNKAGKLLRHHVPSLQRRLTAGWTRGAKPQTAAIIGGELTIWAVSVSEERHCARSEPRTT